MKTESSSLRRSLLWVALVYVAAVAGSVAYCWSIGEHLYDLSLTVSLYVALFRGTSVLYFLAAVVICVLLGRYVWQTPMRPWKKWLYFAIFLCVLGCAWFPCNGSRSRLCRDIHDIFSYVLVILVAVSFGVTTAFPRNRKQRIFGLGSFLFSVYFIAAFVLKLPGFKATVFIWENLIIALLFFELLLERQNPFPVTVSKKQSPATSACTKISNQAVPGSRKTE